MRLFKTNKSQASLQSSLDGGRPQSQEQSPVESAFPPHPHAHAHHGRGGQAQAQPQSLQHIQTDGGNDPPPYQPGQGGNQYQRYDENYSHPAHIPARSQSQRISPTTYSNPTVKLVGPGTGGIDEATTDEAEQQIYPSPLLNRSPHFEDQPEAPKTKRGFFGLSSSLVKDKEHRKSTHEAQQPPKTLGRSISVRRKQENPQPNPQRFSVQDPSAEIRPLREEIEESADDPRLPLNSRNPPYPVSPGIYQQPQQEGSRDRLSLHRVNTDPSLQSPPYPVHPDDSRQPDQVTSRHPAHYYDDIKQPTPQHPQYQTFPPPPPPKSSNTYNPNQLPPSLQLKGNPGLEANRFRPPSQQSIGPPSPLSQQTSFELQRPGQDYRNSLQNFPPPPTPQTQGTMAPSTAQNAPMRGMSMNQQNSQAPPPRSDSMQDQAHNHGGQYGQGPGPPPQSGNRQQHLQQNPENQGRNSPQPSSKSRIDSGDVDVGSLMQKHEDLRTSHLSPVLSISLLTIISISRQILQSQKILLRKRRPGPTAPKHPCPPTPLPIPYLA
jgi:hypothetical protein